MNYSNLSKTELVSIIKELENQNLDKSRDLFLSNISHDVRTLLNAIYGNAQILDSDNSLNDTQQKSVKRIIEASSHMIDLINNIITISKNSGNDKVMLSQFNLSDLLNNIYSIFRTVLLSKNINFELNMNIKKDYIIKTDKNKLFYILLNLVGNATKYTNRGSVIINCNFLQSNKIVFEIIDTGTGIESEKIEDITKEYIRGKNSEGTQGFGLGLGIASKNLSLLGTKLNIKSKLNEGSCFSFEIKCHKNSKTFVSTQDDIFEIKEIEFIKEPNDFFVLVYANNEDEISILNTYFNSRKINYKLVDNLFNLKSELNMNKINMIFIDSNKLNQDEFSFFKEYKNSNNISLITLTSSVMSEELVRINEVSTTYIIEPYSFIDIDQSLIMFSSQEFSFTEKSSIEEEHNLIIKNNIKEDIIKEADFGNYKSCFSLIEKIEDIYSKRILTKYLESYDFDKIIEVLTNYDGFKNEK